MSGRHVLMLMATIATAFVAACAGIPQDDRYQTHDGGRSNTRAEAPQPTGSSPLLQTATPPS